MSLHVVTGLPGAGKTTFCKGQTGAIVYDLDYLAAAMDYGRGTAAARKAANLLLPAVLDVACVNNLELYVIRTSPSVREVQMFRRYEPNYIEMEQNPETCRALRPMTDDEWNHVVMEHEAYLRRVNPREVSRERW